MEKPDILTGEKIISELLNWLKIPMTNSTKDTPKRVAKMYVEEIFNGMYTDAPPIKVFDGDKGYICVTNIKFTSTCEHHLLPFIGKCDIVYFAKNKVIGLSKLARIVRYWSARPQLQERLTAQIAKDIMKRLEPNGVYVVMSAEHSCMTIRGVKAEGAKTVTASLLGDIDKNEAETLLNKNFGV